ncbi:MAG: hypothetical protein JXM73_00400 [Anaerolineae bacterium]|nr:hypothetical protein [Anaerolineae bacterium]
MTDDLQPPAELIEHLNRGDCVLFVGDALDGQGSQSARLAAAAPVGAARANSNRPGPWVCPWAGAPLLCGVQVRRGMESLRR